MPTRLILSFDPGGTTGFARYYLRDQEPQYSGQTDRHITEGWTGGQIGPGKHHKKLWAFLAREEPDWIVCEDFNYEPGHDHVELISRDYIGIIELYCQLTHKKLYMQPRTIMSTEWVKDAKLKLLGLYIPGQPHRNDATRHLVWHVVQTLRRKEILNGLRTR